MDRNYEIIELPKENWKGVACLFLFLNYSFCCFLFSVTEGSPLANSITSSMPQSSVSHNQTGSTPPLP